jgi:hypothetical protein
MRSTLAGNTDRPVQAVLNGLRRARTRRGERRPGEAVSKQGGDETVFPEAFDRNHEEKLYYRGIGLVFPCRIGLPPIQKKKTGLTSPSQARYGGRR